MKTEDIECRVEKLATATPESLAHWASRTGSDIGNLCDLRSELGRQLDTRFREVEVLIAGETEIRRVSNESDHYRRNLNAARVKFETKDRRASNVMQVS